MIKILLLAITLMSSNTFATFCHCRLALDNWTDGPLKTTGSDVGGLFGAADRECREHCEKEFPRLCGDLMKQENLVNVSNAGSHFCDPEVNNLKTVYCYSKAGMSGHSRSGYTCGKLSIVKKEVYSCNSPFVLVGTDMDFPKITGHFRLSGLSPLGGVNRGRKSQKNQTSV